MKSLTFDEIAVGDKATFVKKIADTDVMEFSRLSGDVNPLHVDPSYASQTEFGRCLVHGMFIASLFSQLVGVHLPGKYCLYLTQELTFRNPVYVGDSVTITGTVKSKSAGAKLVELSLQAITNEGKVAVDGVAKVKVLK